MNECSYCGKPVLLSQESRIEYIEDPITGIKKRRLFHIECVNNRLPPNTETPVDNVDVLQTVAHLKHKPISKNEVEKNDQ